MRVLRVIVSDYYYYYYKKQTLIYSLHKQTWHVSMAVK